MFDDDLDSPQRHVAAIEQFFKLDFAGETHELAKVRLYSKVSWTFLFEDVGYLSTCTPQVYQISGSRLKRVNVSAPKMLVVPVGSFEGNVTLASDVDENKANWRLVIPGCKVRWMDLYSTTSVCQDLVSAYLHDMEREPVEDEMDPEFTWPWIRDFPDIEDS